MIKIAPSILAANFANLQRSCEGVLNYGAEMLHIDVMDGHFVPNISLGLPVFSSLAKQVPTCYDVHLMVKEPLSYVESFAKAGADYITFHLEIRTAIMETLETIRNLGKKAGLAIKPNTPIKEVFPFLPYLDLVLIMTVEPGFGGQAFLEGSLEKIETLRKKIDDLDLDVEIEVDGGINELTGPQAGKAGANILVAGSFLFQSPDLPKALAQLRVKR